MQTTKQIGTDNNVQATRDNLLTREIKRLIKHAEDDTMSYHVLEDARKLLFTIESEELIRVPEVTIVQSGEDFIKDQELFRKAIDDLEEMRSRLTRYDGVISILFYQLSKFLDEFEAAFDRENSCVSREIARDYLDAAIFLEKNFKRTNNRVMAVEQWLLGQSI